MFIIQHQIAKMIFKISASAIKEISAYFFFLFLFQLFDIMFQNWCVCVVSCKRRLWRPFMWMRLRWNRCKTIINPFYARSSRSQTFFKIGVLKNCKFHRKTPTLEFLLNLFLQNISSCYFCHVSYLFLRPLKTSENQKAFGYFQGV